jgi:hypothetical protein
MMTSHLGSFFKEEDFPADDRFGLVPAFPEVSCSCAGREHESAHGWHMYKHGKMHKVALMMRFSTS